MPSVSIILATYNAPQKLALALETLLDQTRLPDEIVVADDGSGPETAELLRRSGASSPVPLVHAWHEDRGFRLAASRNNAVRMASGEYLIFMDGDCFVNRHFVEDHLRLAEPGAFVSGTRVNVQPRRQRYIFRTGNRRISFFSWGTTKKWHALRLPFFPRLVRPTEGFAGANFSVWRDDVVRVNGFNEAFEGHGGEDKEFAIRLRNAGLRGLKMRHGGMAYHLAHPELPRGDRSTIDAMIREAREERLVRCRVGLDRHDGTPPATEG